ncbi:hypothetical protein EJ03DRAFT_377705 [Teratosphaeria nubilosa]|uniref:Wax synthase domain-containing protein n=1 Tax=Teratosphaeria nubilosa TaxID=161662 RepID=A0A6G1KZE3_9PEZI|nr:hypothetical protein EJ03DRAFT_377705 [Teratosphaeria nubilosa]
MGPLITWSYLITHILPGPRSPSWFLPVLLLPLALLIPRSTLSRSANAALFLPVIAACVFHSWKRTGALDVVSVDWLLWSFWLLVGRDVQGGFFRVVREGKGKGNGKGEGEGEGDGGIVEEGFPEDFWQRLRWVNKLLRNKQLVNWRIGVRSHDVRQPARPGFRSRGHFLRVAGASLVLAYVMLDLTTAYTSWDPYFTDVATSIDAPLPHPHLSFLPPRVVRTTLHAAQLYAAVGLLLPLPTALPVLLASLHLFPQTWSPSPHKEPRYFGPWSTVFRHGLRGLWGGFWHQNMRFVAGGVGYSLAQALGLKEGGFARYAVLVSMTFLASGVLHMGLVPAEPLFVRRGVGVWGLRGRMAGFFWVQAVGILGEVGVERLVGGKGKGKGGWWRWVGNAGWVFLWLLVTLPVLMDVERQLGYFRVWPVPVSLWRGVRGEGWVVWEFLVG